MLVCVCVCHMGGRLIRAVTVFILCVFVFGLCFPFTTIFTNPLGLVAALQQANSGRSVWFNLHIVFDSYRQRRIVCSYPASLLPTTTTSKLSVSPPVATITFDSKLGNSYPGKI